MIRQMWYFIRIHIIKETKCSERNFTYGNDQIHRNGNKTCPAFKRKRQTSFYAGELSKADYKGFSGGYGSYAQKDGKASMIRLRMSGGHLTKDKLKFIADSIKTYNVDKVHLTTCQTIQLHNLQPEAIYGIMEGGLDHGIVTMGGGGDFPR